MGKELPDPLTAPPDSPARYSTLSLPPYRHVPGLTPHPVKDPAGHLHGLEEGVATTACRSLPESWGECGEYLYGVDLFNRSYLWEAHESWELVWIAAGKTSEPASFVQGLIQVSAALLRRHLGTPRGALNLVTRAGARLAPVRERLAAAGGDRYMGIAIEVWWHSVERYTASGGVYPYLALEAGPPPRELHDIET